MADHYETGNLQSQIEALQDLGYTTHLHIHPKTHEWTLRWKRNAADLWQTSAGGAKQLAHRVEQWMRSAAPMQSAHARRGWTAP